MQNKSAYIWGLVGRFAPQALYLATTMILARFLTPDDFGQIGVLSVIFLVANVLLDSGLGGSLVKEKEISKVDCSSIFVFNTGISVLIYVVLFFSANALEDYFAIEGLAWVICAISLVFPCSAIGIVPKAILNRELRFKEACINALIGVVVASICSIGAAIWGAGVYALVVYQVVCVLATSLANCYSCKYRFSFRFSVESIKRLLPFGIFTTITTVVDTVYENLMTSLTGKFLNVQQAGYLYQAKRIEETLSWSVATAINTVSFPILTKVKDDRPRFLKEANSTFITISSVSIPILMLVAIFSDEIILLLFGSQWLAAGFYLKALTFAGIFLIMETLVRNFIKALCEVKKLLYATFFKRILGIAVIILAMVVSPSYMIYAYIVSTLIGYMINIILYSRITSTNVRSSIGQCLISIIPGLIFFVLFELPFWDDVDIILKILSASIVLLCIFWFILPLQGVDTKSILITVIKIKRR